MRWIQLLAFGAAATMLACGDDATSSAGNPCDGSGADFVVDATNALTFTPEDLTINTGQAVCWQNRGSLVHTVTSDVGTTLDADLGPGASFVHTFASTGSFPYHCEPHQIDGMVGTVTVQ
jgi:plastocyanin